MVVPCSALEAIDWPKNGHLTQAKPMKLFGRSFGIEKMFSLSLWELTSWIENTGTIGDNVLAVYPVAICNERIE
jgi:hypothetical protein